MSMASATTATSKDESTQELSQAKNIIDAQRLESFSLTQELMALKASAQLATSTIKTIFIAPAIEQAPPSQETHQDLPDIEGRWHGCPQGTGSMGFMVQRRSKPSNNLVPIWDYQSEITNLRLPIWDR